MKTLIPILIPGLALLSGCGSSHSAPEAAAAPVPVRVVTVAASSIPSTYEATGTVRARTAAQLSSRVMAYVREVRVHAGDHVRQGQLLVLLDARDLDAGLRQADAALAESKSAIPEAENAMAAAKASLELTEVTFKRMEDLFQKRSISNQEFDEASAKLKLAQANYEMARARQAQLQSKILQADAGRSSAEVMQGYSEVRAPFDGMVTEKPVEPGNLAAPGAPLLTLEREGSYRLEVSVEESKLPRIRNGETAQVSIEALDRGVAGRISEIVPAVDASSRSFVVKIDLPGSAQLRSGLFGRARFTFGQRDAITVPAAALLERGQLTSVMVAEDAVARARLVTLGQKLDDRVEILSGLNPGEKVVYPLPSGLNDGGRVEVRP